MSENQKKPDTAPVTLQENDAPENFYAGARRGEVLLQMTQALKEDVTLLVLTGDEGSGKTTICRLLEREAAKFCYTVFLTKSVESFEDVVRKMAMWLGVASDGGNDGKNVDRVLSKITAHLKREAAGLLVIFDEAENIYLATLERIRKMLDRMTQDGAHLHIVFSGRKTFLNNYAQLSICNFQELPQLQFDLAPLSAQETGEYLHAYAMGAEGSARQTVFSEARISNIFSLAEGNFRKTNLLAEESLRSPGDDTAITVSLAEVREPVGAKRVRKRRQGAKPGSTSFTRYLPWAGGVAGVLLLLFFLMRPGGDQGDGKIEAPQEPAAGVQVAEAPTVPEEKNQAEEKKSAPLPVVPAVQPASQVPSVASPSETPDPVKDRPAEMAAEEPVDKVKVAGIAEEKAAAKEEMVARETPAKKVVPPPVSVRVSPPPAATVKQIRQDRPMKVKKIVATGGKVNSSSEPPVVKETTAAKNQQSVDQLLQKRMVAGSAWTKKGKEDAYTMQLMALTDKNAEDNLKKMLAQPQYRQEAGNFYVFKKSAASTTVFVFYGEYPSLAMARAAQGKLPAFLVNHQPYPISIKGAMAKVKR